MSSSHSFGVVNEDVETGGVLLEHLFSDELVLLNEEVHLLVSLLHRLHENSSFSIEFLEVPLSLFNHTLNLSQRMDLGDLRVAIRSVALLVDDMISVHFELGLDGDLL